MQQLHCSDKPQWDSAVVSGPKKAQLGSNTANTQGANINQ